MPRRTPSTWLTSIATVLAVIGAGALFGGAVFNYTGRAELVALVWIAMLLALSAIWGRRLAALFLVPTSVGFVTGELVGIQSVNAAFYGAASQVGPVLLLALGLEQWSLRRYARTPFELTLFAVLIAYVTVGVAASLYGSAACDQTSSGCWDVIVEFHMFDQTDFIVTAANAAAAGMAAGLVAIPVLALIIELSPIKAAAMDRQGAREPKRPPRRPSLAEVIICWLLLRRP